MFVVRLSLCMLWAGQWEVLKCLSLCQDGLARGHLNVDQPKEARLSQSGS